MGASWERRTAPATKEEDCQPPGKKASGQAKRVAVSSPRSTTLKPLLLRKNRYCSVTAGVDMAS